ncbi:tRNA threonylcarbamoyladenosine dehydratase [Lagierella sp.]|uniref:tRNA threonylcarbamoyladenosine dehydratase n=1 Tax=Lagierella sp. TaxID=2849657 RepID=UPI00262579DE|nr:tRNA threonylcarbamoyladenosine dehydratase [Lagierella sp.]
MKNNFTQRTALLIGEEAIEKLSKSKIIVFGLGGVGGICAEALVRAGIFNITIVDYDNVDVTNINRQIIATTSTVGRPKVEVMRERLLDINPECKVKVYKEKLTEENVEFFDLVEYDYIVDCIDFLKGKIALAKFSYDNNLRLISAMGAGNKLDPTGFMISDIYKTEMCPVARVMRRELKNLGVKSLKVVWSKEKPSGDRYVDEETKKISPSSISFVPPAAGLAIAGEVIRDLIKVRKD